jgi:hypothetical protein
VWVIVMSLVMGWLGRTRDRQPERAGSGIVLRNPPSLLVVGVVCIALFMTAAVAALLTTQDGRGPFYFVWFTGFALLGVPLVADYYIDRFEVRDDGLTFRTTFGGGGTAAWTDITRVTYSQGLKWFRFVLADGRVVRVSVMMIGLPTLAQYVLSRAANATLDATTRRILTDTAAGNPPPVWV